MVSQGRFCARNLRFGHEILCVGTDPRRGLLLIPRKADIRRLKGDGGVFPRLRRKTGLCYTADANSPFEAYIYVR
jgi:hypothetical protein